MARPLYEIAEEIASNWKPVHPTARPYLAAMLDLNSMGDRYGADDAESIVMYFLTNAGQWRGPVAKNIKQELKTMLKKRSMYASAQRVAQRYVGAASKDTFHTDAGNKFVLDIPAFARFLRDEMGVKPGAPAGRYYREEDLVPDKFLQKLRDKYKARVTGLPREPRSDRGQTRKKRGPDISKLWDALTEALWSSVKGEGSDIGDWYVRDPSIAQEDLDSFLQAAAGDLSMSWEYALSGKAEQLWYKFQEALKTGVYQSNGYERWSLRERKETLGSIYADAWYTEMSRAWQKLQKNPREMARLDAMRASYSR